MIDAFDCDFLRSLFRAERRIFILATKVERDNFVC